MEYPELFSFDTNVLEGYANGGLKGGKGKLELQGRSLKFKYYVTLVITVKGNNGSFWF